MTPTALNKVCSALLTLVADGFPDIGRVYINSKDGCVVDPVRLDLDLARMVNEGTDDEEEKIVDSDSFAS